jgi:hypothetical protein
MALVKSTNLSLANAKEKVYKLDEECFVNKLSSYAQSQCHGAYSTRLVRAEYTGPMVKVRRGSDNAVLDFYGDVDGNLGTRPFGAGTSLLSWLNGATGYVGQMFDQSGWGRDIIQNVDNSFQPVISYNASSNTPQITYNGTTHFLVSQYGTRSHPPAALTGNSTTLSSQSHGNGTYIASASSILNVNYDANKAFDNDMRSDWQTEESQRYNPTTGVYIGNATTTANGIVYSGEWLQIQLPTAICLSSHTIVPKAGYYGVWAPRSFVVLGSNDGSTWNLVHEERNMNTWESNQIPKTFIITKAPPSSFTHYRIVIRQVGQESSNQGYASIANWNLESRGVPFGGEPTVALLSPVGMSANSTTLEGGTYNASASSTLAGGYEPFNAFDNSGVTFWHSSEPVYNGTTGQYTGAVSTTANGISYSGEWLQIQLAFPIVLRHLMIGPRSGNETNRSPRSFVILGSNNGSTWDLLHEETNVNDWAALTAKTFAILRAVNAYSFYRIVVRRVGNADSGSGQTSVQIAEWGLYGNMGSKNNTYVVDYTPAQVSSAAVLMDQSGDVIASNASNGLFLWTGAFRMYAQNNDAAFNYITSGVRRKIVNSNKSGVITLCDNTAFYKSSLTAPSLQSTGTHAFVVGKQVSGSFLYTGVLNEIIAFSCDLKVSDALAYYQPSTRTIGKLHTQPKLQIANIPKDTNPIPLGNMRVALDMQHFVGVANNTALSGTLLGITAVNAPTYFNNGGYRPETPYINLNRTDNEHLSVGSTVLNVASNGGFTAICLIQFTGTLANYERIFDFGNGQANDNMLLARFGTGANLTFGYFNGTGYSDELVTSTSPIVQEEWAVYSCRYTASTRVAEIFKNGVLIATKTFGTAITDRTTANNYVARSNWAGDVNANMNLGGFYMYDISLTETQMGTIANHLIMSTITTVPYNVPSYTNNIVTRVGSVQSRDNRQANSMYFPKSYESYIDIQDMPAPPITISFWFKTGSSAGQRIGGLTNNSRVGGPIFILLNSGTDLSIGQSTAYTSSITCALNTWHHVAIAYAPNNVFTCYVNGALIPGTSTVTAVMENPQLYISRLILGASPENTDGTSFDGYLHDIRIYDYLLNSVDVARLGAGWDEKDTTSIVALKEPSQYLVNRTNWYKKMSVAQVTGSYTPVLGSSDPTVEYQLASSSVLTTCNHVTHLQRIQDYDSFVCAFEIYTSSANADALWFYAGATTPSTVEYLTQSGVNIGFGVWPSTVGRGVHVFTGDTARATTREQDWRNSSKWTKVLITYNKSAVGTWTINVSGRDVLTYSDPNHSSYLTSSGSYWGLAARTGGQSMDAYIRCVELSYVPSTTTLSALVPSNTMMSFPNGHMYNNSIVQTNLVAYFDPTHQACYPGVGNTLTSLVGSVTGTLNGTYGVDAGGIRLYNSNSDWNSNASTLQLSSISNITTVSLWYYQASNTANIRMLLDARTGIGLSEVYNSTINPLWTTLYKNGGSALAMTWENIETVGVWQNITLITSTPGTDDLTLFGHYLATKGGLDAIFGPILVYNRAITQAENLQNFNAIKDTLGTPYNASSSSQYNSFSDPGYNAGKAFDVSSSSIWVSGAGTYNSATGAYTGSASTSAGGTTYSGEWLQTRLSQPIVLKNYTITPLQSPYPPGYARVSPRSFVVLGSNDGSNWTLVDDETGITNWYLSSKTFEVSRTPQAFSYFRLVTREVGNLTSGGTGQSELVIAKWDLNAYSNTPTGTKYPIGSLYSEYPSVALSSTSTAVSAESYGNGLYIASASSNHSSTNFSPFRAFDKLSGENVWHSSNDNKYNTTTGAYTGATSTTIDGSAYAGEWLQIQLPSPITLKSYTLRQRQGYNQLAKTWKLVGSNDGSTWRILDTQTSITNIEVQSEEREFTVNATIAYSFYRIIGNVAQDTAGAFVVGEMRLFARTSIPGNEFGCGEYIATASSNFSKSEHVIKVFDGSTGQWTHSSQAYNISGAYTGGTTTTVSGVSYSGEWIQLQLPSAISLTSYFLYQPSIRAPKSFVVAGSNDGSTWTLLDTETDVTGVDTGRTFATTALGKYSYYRLIVTKAVNGVYALDFTSVTEWALYDSSVSMSAIAGKSKGLIEGLTWKFANGYMNDTPSYFDTNGYQKIGRTSDLTSLATATNGQYYSSLTIDSFSLEFTGYFRPMESGIHTFYTVSDDCSFIWLGSSAATAYTTLNSFVNNGGVHGSQMRSFSVYLVAGTYYPIRIQFGESSGGHSFSMYFKTPSGTTITNGYGYYFSSIGTNSAYPAESARVIKDLTNTNVDGVYYINCNGVSEPTYCLMNDRYDGGGWMMLMKATRGTTFQYTANYWTSANTLNATDVTRSDADAKYNSFNYVPVKDVMAIFPDVSSSTSTNIYGKNGGSLNLEDGWCWKVNNWNGSSKATALAGFSTSRDAFPANPFTSNGYSSTVWSSQPGSFAHVFGGGTHLNGADGFVRWGYIFNNQGPNAFGTTDVVCGIGIPASTVSSNANYSAGDCPNIGSGGSKTIALNRSMRVEVYGR